MTPGEMADELDTAARICDEYNEPSQTSPANYRAAAAMLREAERLLREHASLSGRALLRPQWFKDRDTWLEGGTS